MEFDESKAKIVTPKDFDGMLMIVVDSGLVQVLTGEPYQSQASPFC